MSTITLQNASQPEITMLSNSFIDYYMPQANGEFVKVYLYLLRIMSASPASFSLEQMADTLLCTEKDINRALLYWEKAGLLSLNYTSNNVLCGITLRHPSAKTAAPSPESSLTASSPQKKTVSCSLTLDRVKELKKDQKIVQLLFIAEQYLGKTLSPTEIQKILYFYDELKMSPELIEYLIEYCVSKNHKSIRYIETVALAWAQENITTVEMARETVSRYSKEYYSILKSMGISGRNPVDNEIAFMDIWLNKYGFSLPLIQEACSRTVLQTGQSSFQYADKILSGWKKKNVTSLEDVHRLDMEHQQKKQTRSARPASQPKAPNRFNNFHQREYDFDEYEKRLLNQ